jgi:hypothetical protein
MLPHSSLIEPYRDRASPLAQSYRAQRRDFAPLLHRRAASEFARPQSRHRDETVIARHPLAFFALHHGATVRLAGIQFP